MANATRVPFQRQSCPPPRVTSQSSLPNPSEPIQVISRDVLQKELLQLGDRLENMIRQEMGKHYDRPSTPFSRHSSPMPDRPSPSNRASMVSCKSRASKWHDGAFTPLGFHNKDALTTDGLHKVGDTRPPTNGANEHAYVPVSVEGGPKVADSRSLVLSGEPERKPRASYGESNTRPGGVEEKPVREERWWIMHRVQTEAFDYLVGVAVLLNAAWVVAQTDYSARHLGSPVPVHFLVVDHVFVAFFALEIILRALAYRSTFFIFVSNNYIDTFVISLQICDELVGICFYIMQRPYKYSHTLSIFRLIRVFRLIRIIKNAHVLEFIGELRMLIVSVMDCIRGVVWANIFLVVITLMFSVCITQFYIDEKLHRSVLDEDATLKLYYGSVGATMLTLYEIILNGLDWGRAIRPLMAFSRPWSAVALLCYCTLGMLGVLNMVTGVFMTSVMRRVNDDREFILLKRMYKFFIEADDDESGTITWSEFQEHMHSAIFQKYLEEIDLSVDNALQLYRLLDFEETGDIPIDEIVNGCKRLHGPAKALDLAIHVQDFTRTTNLILDKLEALEYCSLGLAQVPRGMTFP